MPKLKTRYVCTNCGAISQQWLGKCQECNAWNSFTEEVEEAEIKIKTLDPLSATAEAKLLSEININGKTERVSTGSKELDGVLGGGIVAGEVILLGGDPGIGKSTLALQLAGKINKTLYVSGEEGLEQLKMRAERLGIASSVYLLNSINIKEIEKIAKKLEPQLMIVDSIQTIYHPEIPSAPGSVAQVRESAAYLIRMAKAWKVPLILIGHITKDGSIAGPKILEHLVDAVLYFEGDKRQDFRILRAVKNRYGAIDEIGVFAMKQKGLEEVRDFANIFVNSASFDLPGTIISASVEGSRSFLVEIQALAAATAFSMPKRVITGVDANRVAIITAVIEKKLGLYLSQRDIFINVVGGLRLTEPAMDLAIALAIISSFKELAWQAAAVGEIGLSGELRPVAQLEKRINELSKIGIKKIFVPQVNKVPKTELVIPINSVEDLLKYL